MRNRRQFLALTVAATAMMVAGPLTIGRASASTDLSAFVTEAAKASITELSKAAPTENARAAALKPVLLKYFDMPDIAKHVLGGYWKRLDADQQKQYVAQFVDYIASVYAKRFEEYDGKQLEVKRVRDQGANATVFTAVEGGQGTRIDWDIRTDGATPLITDIRVEGLSLADTHRQEFISVMSQHHGDISALMGIMKSKSVVN